MEKAAQACHDFIVDLRSPARWCRCGFPKSEHADSLESPKKRTLKTSLSLCLNPVEKRDLAGGSQNEADSPSRAAVSAACGDFKIDPKASFGLCRCGYPKSAHSESPTSEARTLRGASASENIKERQQFFSSKSETCGSAQGLPVNSSTHSSGRVAHLDKFETYSQQHHEHRQGEEARLAQKLNRPRSLTAPASATEVSESELDMIRQTSEPISEASVRDLSEAIGSATGKFPVDGRKACSSLSSEERSTVSTTDLCKQQPSELESGNVSPCVHDVEPSGWTETAQEVVEQALEERVAEEERAAALQAEEEAAATTAAAERASALQAQEEDAAKSAAAERAAALQAEEEVAAAAAAAERAAALRAKEVAAAAAAEERAAALRAKEIAEAAVAEERAAALRAQEVAAAAAARKKEEALWTEAAQEAEERALAERAAAEEQAAALRAKEVAAAAAARRKDEAQSAKKRATEQKALELEREKAQDEEAKRQVMERQQRIDEQEQKRLERAMEREKESLWQAEMAETEAYAKAAQIAEKRTVTLSCGCGGNLMVTKDELETLSKYVPSFAEKPSAELAELLPQLHMGAWLQGSKHLFAPKRR